MLVACCLEEHVIVTRVCLLLVVQKDTWLFWHCRWSATLDHSAHLHTQRIWESLSISTGITTVLGSSLINEWSADGCWIGNCSYLWKTVGVAEKVYCHNIRASYFVEALARSIFPSTNIHVARYHRNAHVNLHVKVFKVSCEQKQKRYDDFK